VRKSATTKKCNQRKRKFALEHTKRVIAMTGREVKTQYHVKEWAEKFSARARSGQTVKAWCAENGVNIRKYYYWLRKVRDFAAQMMSAAGGETLAAESSKELVPQTGETTELGVPAGFALVVPPECSTNSAKSLPIEIGKFRVLAEADTDPELLKSVCKVLVTLC
jgi:hypothetical protein